MAETGNKEIERNDGEGGGDIDKGKCFRRREKENETHLSLDCTKTQRRIEGLRNNRWQRMTEGIACKKLFTCDKRADLRSLGSLLCNIKC
jgi:hypothetical protein